MAITRHFFPWDRPVLDAMGDRLMKEVEGSLFDLSHLLVVVPTRNAGRLLRERLAQLSHEKDRGILPPLVYPPEALLGLISEPDEGSLASPQEGLLAWIDVLRQADLRDYRALFPVDPVDQNFSWALGAAQSFQSLRRVLGEAGLEMTDVPRLLAGELEEPERWVELARLEHAYHARLAKEDRVDLLWVRKDRAPTPDVIEGIKEIWVTACPDPIPLTIEVLGALSSVVPVQIWIQAPESLSDAFDLWGRPLTDIWSSRSLPFTEFEDQVQVLPHPTAQAMESARIIQSYEDPASAITVGVLDEEVGDRLMPRLEEAGIPTFSPQGFPLRSQGILHLFRCLRNLMRSHSFRDFLELLRCPDYAAYLATDRLFWSTPVMLEQCDELSLRHFPSDLAEGKKLLKQGSHALGDAAPDLLSAIEETEALLLRLDAAPFPEALPDILHQLFSSRKTESEGKLDRALQACAAGLQPSLDAMESPFVSREEPPSALESFEFALTSLETDSVYPERTSGAVEMLGWLELAWDDAPHLLLAGFNDGFVPDAIVGDVFLPEQLRGQIAKRLHFKTNDQRFARDAYLLEALLHSRNETNGRIDLLVGKRSTQGEPLRPSRLLFLCDDANLPTRARFLFREVSESEPSLPWAPGFRLRPTRDLTASPPSISSLPVTAFRDYLESPFHFYLKHIERMRAVETERGEIDAATFGNLLHEVLQSFGQESGIRHASDEERIRDYLHTELDRLAKRWFGRSPALPIRMQLDSARQRLAAAARVQAQDRHEGWKIIEVEQNLGHRAWKIDGVAIRGRVDRIDKHTTTGQIRVIDYKTSERPVYPRAAHSAAVSASTGNRWVPDYACWSDGARTHRWKNLQLPLYRLGLQSEWGDHILCAYFNLPKSVSETAIVLWEELSPLHDEAAQSCASGIIADVRKGNFWPCEVRNRWDDFAPLHLFQPDQTIQSESFGGEEEAADEISPF